MEKEEKMILLLLRTIAERTNEVDEDIWVLFVNFEKAFYYCKLKEDLRDSGISETKKN